MTEAQPAPIPTPQPAAPTVKKPMSTPAGSTDYASFGRRFVAVFVDAIVVGIINSVLTVVLTAISQDLQTVATLLNFVVGIVYYVYFIGSSGQTIGKKLLKVRVVKKDDTTTNPDYLAAVLREVIGKPLSALVLGLGYFWMLWDDHKQTWADKIAGTVVINVPA